MNLDRIIALIESVQDVKTLYMGETILDEYRFGHAMGKPGKENILAMRIHKAEIYEGGVKAAAAHGASFCQASIFTVGNELRKIRYVDETYNRKIFECQYLDETKNKQPLPAKLINGFDVVAITDFGHGMFEREAIEQACELQTFLAVCCQTNAANLGYNLITKWPQADYVVIDEPEARLAAQDRDGPIWGVMDKLSAGRCSKMIVTHGRNGAYGIDEHGHVQFPAFTENVVDTMGAGDAFFAVTAPMAKTGCLEDLMIIGNAAGAIKCGVVGHRESVTKEALIKFLRAHA